METGSQSRLSVLLLKKFNSQLMFQSCSWSGIDCVITNQRPPENIVSQLKRYDVELMIVEG
jgi:DeoR/GlpR family transcriptional regulator of sugar metabolism